MEPAILRVKDTQNYLGISKTTLWRWAKVPGFPTPVRLGEHATGWLRVDLDAWLQSQKGVQA